MVHRIEEVPATTPLLIDMTRVQVAGFWYQWLTSVCAIAFAQRQHATRSVAFATHPKLLQSLQRVGLNDVIPTGAAAAEAARVAWLIATGTRSHQALLASVPWRKALYEKMRCKGTRESDAAYSVMARIGQPYSCLIVRGVPDVATEGDRPLSADSHFYTALIGRTQIQPLYRALNLARWPDAVRSNPVLVCGDSYEDEYAALLREQGIDAFSKDRSSMVRDGLDGYGLALVDFLLALDSTHLFGLSSSALYFAAREARLYLRDNSNSWEYLPGQPIDFGSDRRSVTSLEWAAQVMVCDLIEGRISREFFRDNFQNGDAMARLLAELSQVRE